MICRATLAACLYNAACYLRRAPLLLYFCYCRYAFAADVYYADGVCYFFVAACAACYAICCHRLRAATLLIC